MFHIITAPPKGVSAAVYDATAGCGTLNARKGLAQITLYAKYFQAMGIRLSGSKYIDNLG